MGGHASQFHDLGYPSAYRRRRPITRRLILLIEASRRWSHGASAPGIDGLIRGEPILRAMHPDHEGAWVGAGDAGPVRRDDRRRVGGPGRPAPGPALPSPPPSAAPPTPRTPGVPCPRPHPPPAAALWCG